MHFSPAHKVFKNSENLFKSVMYLYMYMYLNPVILWVARCIYILCNIFFIHVCIGDYFVGVCRVYLVSGGSASCTNS